MIDIGVIVTGFCVLSCLLAGRDTWLCGALALSWSATAVMVMAGAGKDVFVLAFSALDMLIALTSLTRFTLDHSNHGAQVVAGMSLAMMPPHFLMSASLGNVNWTLYASACNLVFVLQCLVAGGWLDGVGRRIADFRGRFRSVHRLRGGGR